MAQSREDKRQTALVRVTIRGKRFQYRTDALLVAGHVCLDERRMRAIRELKET